jgi:prepilin-type N-terminal cleavage/methylation domain-containing protein
MRARRRGITLIEVLAAIFVMGIGLLALLTLFPVGALSMARAVRDDRAAQAGANGAALAVAIDLRNDPAVSGALAATPNTWADPDPNGPGYPIYVDPYYVNLVGTAALGAAGTTPGLARTTTPLFKSAPARWASLQDEIEFDNTGTPGGAVNRPATYTWAYLMRRTRASSNVMVELTVVVYASRATQVGGGENVYAATGTKGESNIVLTYTGDKPNIRRNSWLLDVSYQESANPAGVQPVKFGTVNGFLYRVANVTDAGAGTLSIDLEAPLRQDVATKVVGQPAAAGNVVFMENVIGVLEKSTSWQP